MSSIKLESNASGTGVFTIASPNSNTNRTLTLPDATGTIITTAGGAAISGTTGTFTGLVDISAAGAGQIQFPATQNASSNVNTLDDYEEGTWTATFAASGATFTNNARDTRYTKIGNLVTVMGYLQVNCSAGSGANAVTISGLPFTSLNTTYNYVSGACYGSTVANSNGFTIMLGVAPNGTTMTLDKYVNSSGTTVINSVKSQDITDSNFSFRFSFSYTASA